MEEPKDVHHKEYENRVADILSFLAGDTATVKRNQYLWDSLGETRRQIDIVVRGRLGNLENGLMIVDCKKWKDPIDIRDMGTFIDMTKNVGADVGLIMTSNHKTGAPSYRRAKNEEGRDIRIDVLDIDALLKWNPPGSVKTTYRFPIQHRAEAEKKLRNAGFTIRDSRAPEPSETEAVLEISRHYGISSPDADTQREQWDIALAAMKKAGVSDPIHVNHGIALAGGNPLRPWVQATIDGQPIDHHFEAVNEVEVERNLDRLFSAHPIFTEHNITRDRLSYVKPEGWPVENWPLRGFIGPTEGN